MTDSTRPASSPMQVEALRARVSRDDVSNVIAEVMDAQHLTFADETFDGAFSFCERGRRSQRCASGWASRDGTR